MDPFKVRSVARSIIIASCRLESFANKHIFAELGLTLALVKIMHAVSARPNISPSGIISLLGSSKSNMTQRLNLLEKKGLVKRFVKKSCNDNRKISIRLTKKGNSKHKECMDAIKERSLDLEACFTRQEIKAHLAFMKKLSKVMDLAEEKTGDKVRIRIQSQTN